MRVRVAQLASRRAIHCYIRNDSQRPMRWHRNSERLDKKNVCCNLCKKAVSPHSGSLGSPLSADKSGAAHHFYFGQVPNFLENQLNKITHTLIAAALAGGVLLSLSALASDEPTSSASGMSSKSMMDKKAASASMHASSKSKKVKTMMGAPAMGSMAASASMSSAPAMKDK